MDYPMVVALEELRDAGGTISSMDWNKRIMPRLGYVNPNRVKMRHLGLIRKVRKETYQITELGRNFLEGSVAVPSQFFMFNNKVHSISPEMVYVDQVQPYRRSA